MVNFSDMMEQRQSKLSAVGVEEATKKFVAVATPDDPSPEVIGKPVIDRERFMKLMHELIDHADKATGGTTEKPSEHDLEHAFTLADSNSSGFLCESEFVAVYTLAVEGKILGLDTSVQYYRPPAQLRKWGEHDQHPETDWADLFYDLLFVGAAYQAGHLFGDALMEDQGWEGLPWFLLALCVLGQQWLSKLNIECRFAYASFTHGLLIDSGFVCGFFSRIKRRINDGPLARDQPPTKHTHNPLFSLFAFLLAIEFTLVAYAIWNIPSSPRIVHTGAEEEGRRRFLEEESDGDRVEFSPLEQLVYNVDQHAFGFSVAIALNGLLYVFKALEILAAPGNTPGAIVLAKFTALQNAVQFGIFGVAAAVTRMETTDSFQEEGGRHCLYIWAAAVLLNLGLMVLWVHYLHTRADPRHFTVPMSVHLCMHRLGEWTMLMIGETVLGLVTVAQSDAVLPYLIFCAGMIIATSLSFQHYAAYPESPSKHVLGKSMITYPGLVYMFGMIYVYSPSLIMVGVSTRVLLMSVGDGEIQEDTDWALAGGLAIAYACLNLFTYLHDPDKFKAMGWPEFLLRVGSTLAYVVVGLIEQLPGANMLECCIICLFQSFITVYFAKHPGHGGHGHDDHGHGNGGHGHDAHGGGHGHDAHGGHGPAKSAKVSPEPPSDAAGLEAKITEVEAELAALKEKLEEAKKR